jgi:S1-C subfamily serine protease
MAVFAGLAAALGYVLSWIPNVELLTFTVFAAGVALGAWRGAAVGALAMAIYSGANPHGSGLAIPPLYAGQVLGAAFAGVLGGASGRLWSGPRRLAPATGALAGAALGLAVTFVYQALVVAGLAASLPEARSGLLAALASNALFSLVHLASNTVVFAVLAPVVLPRLRTAPSRTP